LKYLILIFSFITSGCGSYVNNIKNCLPQAEFISSEKFQFASRLLIDKSLKNSFDPLDVSHSNKDEYFKSRKVKRHTEFPEYEGTKLTVYPESTKLILTGEAKKYVTWGIPAYFKDDTIYLKGAINNKTVWAAPVYFYGIGGRDDLVINQESMKVTGLDRFDLRSSWNCPLN